jgi:hypothetical protein
MAKNADGRAVTRQPEAVARPMPDPAPVTSATLPSNSIARLHRSNCTDGGNARRGKGFREIRQIVLPVL